MLKKFNKVISTLLTLAIVLSVQTAVFADSTNLMDGLYPDFCVGSWLGSHRTGADASECS